MDGRTPRRVRAACLAAEAVAFAVGVAAWSTVVVAVLAATGGSVPALPTVAVVGLVFAAAAMLAPTAETPDASRFDELSDDPQSVFVAVAPAAADPTGCRILVSPAAHRLLPPAELDAVIADRQAVASHGGPAVADAARRLHRLLHLTTAPAAALTRHPPLALALAILCFPIVPALVAGVVLACWGTRVAAWSLLRPAAAYVESLADASSGTDPDMLLRATARLDLFGGLPPSLASLEPLTIGGPTAAAPCLGRIAPAFTVRHARLAARGAGHLGGAAMTRPSWLLGTAAGAARGPLLVLVVLVGIAAVLLLLAAPVWLLLQTIEAAELLGGLVRGFVASLRVG